MSRRGESGAEAVELMALMPLLCLLAAGGWQVIAWGRAQAEAEADARALARQAVICAAEVPAPGSIDPALDRDGVVEIDRSERDWVTVRVSLPPPLLAGLGRAPAGLSPKASVTMRHEPC